MGLREVMQVCLNGHVINDSVHSYPEYNQDYCSDCGAATITACPICDTGIKPYYINQMPVAQSYCHACGHPYPWTERKLEAARELVDLEESISPAEKEALKADLPALLTTTPRTQLAATKVKVFMTKASKTIAEGLYKIVVDIASETAKNYMGLP